MTDPRLEDYILRHTTPESPLLQELYRKTYLQTTHPRMISGPVQGKFLSLISHMIRPDRILEIGTFTGYSAICLAEGLNSGGKLHAIEAEPAYADIAREYFLKTGIAGSIVLHIGNALEIIPNLNETFGLVFIDAAKEQYVDYYNVVFDKVRPGGFILADNALWDGKVLDGPGTSDPETKGIISFNDLIRNDIRVNHVLVPIRDGVMMIRKL